MPYAAALPAAPPAPAPRRPALRARLRRALALDFAGLDRLDLGSLADLNTEVAEQFSRGGHRA